MGGREEEREVGGREGEREVGWRERKRETGRRRGINGREGMFLDKTQLN